MNKTVTSFVALAVTTSAIAQTPSYILPNSKKYPAAKAHFIAIVKSKLKDAESAKFGSVIVCNWSPSLKLALVNVNAKNSFGAYTGYKIGSVRDDGSLKRVIILNARPIGPEQYQQQQALLSDLEACEPAMQAYKSSGFEN